MREAKGRNLLDFPNSYVVVDVETTGLDPARDYIIEVAALKINDGNVSDTYSSLINPDITIDSFITELTGITNQDLSTAPSSISVLSSLYDFIGNAVIIGHNVHFDINFLYDNFKRYISKPLSNNYIDTLRLSRKYFRKAPSYKLKIVGHKGQGVTETVYTHLELPVKLEAINKI